MIAYRDTAIRNLVYLVKRVLYLMFIRNKTPGLENNQEGPVYVGVQSFSLQILQDSKYCLVIVHVEEHLQNERSCYYFRYSSYIQPSSVKSSVWKTFSSCEFKTEIEDLFQKLSININSRCFSIWESVTSLCEC